MWQTVLGVFAAIALTALFIRRYLRRREDKARLFGDCAGLLDGPRFVEAESIGYPILTGTYHGLTVQIHPVIDTLATRRLPALWLLVTLQGALPVTAKFDMMMRPSGPTTFSNFDLLPATIPHPTDFPEQAAIRTDDPAHMLPPHVIEPHLAPFRGPKAKELLITPNGLRIVWLLAEADRVRYGVFREAHFGDVTLERDVLSDLLDRLLALRQSIFEWHKRT